MRRLITILLLVVFPISARPTILRLEWNEFQAVADNANFRQMVTVWTGPRGTGRVRGKLEAVTETELVLQKGMDQARINRLAVHSVRLSRKKGNPFRWRAVACIVLAPLWFAGMNVGLMIPGGIPEGRWWKNRHAPQGWLMSIALPAGIYLLALRADKGNGDFIVELKRGKENRP